MSAPNSLVARANLDANKLSDPVYCVSELNKRYAVVKFGGKALVLDEWDAIDYLGFNDFKRLFSNAYVTIGRYTEPLGEFWLKAPGRRQYLDGVTFDPGAKSRAGTYNLWTGFAVDPDQSKSCDKFLEHVETVICDGVAERLDYLLNWLAFMIQKPNILPGVAIGLLSEQGTGKGLFMQYLCKLIGRHYKHIADKTHLVGNFSGHLQDALLVFADELSWTGSRDDAGVLKTLITEPNRMTEKKFVDAVAVKNCVHLIIASNDSWAIPAEVSDRRYCVFETSSCKRGDHRYFTSFANEMNGGGPSGLLHLLQNRDISSFNPSHFPRTSARTNQQLQSLPSIEKWLFECLQTGQIQGEGECWPETSFKPAVFEEFCSWSTKRGEFGKKPSLSAFTSTLKKYGISPVRETTGLRRYQYHFPDLQDVRERFTAVLCAEIDWEKG